MVGHDDELSLFTSAARFSKGRRRMRRLDLGNCPLDLLRAILPTLPQLRVLRLRAAFLSDPVVSALAAALPHEMCAIHVAVTGSARPLHEYAREFARFPALSILHLNKLAHRRPQPSTASSDKLGQAQTDAWLANATQRSPSRALARLCWMASRTLHYRPWESRGGFRLKRTSGAEAARLWTRRRPWRL